MLPVSLFIDGYAYMDAVVRFPSIPRLESYFALKLMASVIAKTVIYVVGFSETGHWGLVFLSALFMNVWLLPVMYLMVLPFGDSSPFRKDRDLAIELLLFIIDPVDRQDKIHSARMAWLGIKKRMGLLRTVSVSPRKGSLPVTLAGLPREVPIRTELTMNEKAYI
jgi:hypothetical protein